MAFKVLLFLLSTLGFTVCWPPCSEITHSQCRFEDEQFFVELDVIDKAGCQEVCEAVGERCKFAIFDLDAYGQAGNCRLSDEVFAHTITLCNVLTGPKTAIDTCNYTNPPDNTCQILRRGKCHFDNAPEEIENLNSWEHCHDACNATTECEHWRFLKEEGQCHIMYSSQQNCTWQFLPRTPHFDACDRCCPLVSTSTTTTSSTSTTTAASTSTVSPCMTVGGPQVGVPCVFPFIAREKTYTGCTSAGGYSEPWCGTAVDASGVMISGNWGNCPLEDSSCPIDESKI